MQGKQSGMIGFPDHVSSLMTYAFRIGGIVLLGSMAAGCSSATNFLQPASPIADQEAALYRILLVLSAIVFLVVQGLLLYNLIRFRKLPHHHAEPDQHYRHLLIESIYTGIPFLVVVGIFVLTISTMRSIAQPDIAAGDLQVRVVGHQWWWEFEYPDLGLVTANELHVPVGTTVHLDLDSVDVIHSFYVPALSGKTDVIPGLINQMWFRGNEIGVFPGQCAEFCGLNHARMRFFVHVESQEDFDAWVRNQQQPPTAPQTDLQQRGQDIIVNGPCASCHVLGDSGPSNPIGPNLTHLFSRETFAGASFALNEANLRRWLQDTQAMKPGNDMQVDLSSDQIDALIAYLQTLE